MSGSEIPQNIREIVEPLCKGERYLPQAHLQAAIKLNAGRLLERVGFPPAASHNTPKEDLPDSNDTRQPAA